MSKSNEPPQCAPEYEGAVHDLVCDLMDELTMYASDHTLSRSTKIIELSGCELTLAHEWKLLLADEEKLLGINVPCSIACETRVLRLIWPSHQELEKLTKDYNWETISEDYGSIVWDKNELTEEDFTTAISYLDELQIAEDLIEFFGAEANVSYDAYPKRLQPFLRSCVTNYHHEKERLRLLVQSDR